MPLIGREVLTKLRQAGFDAHHRHRQTNHPGRAYAYFRRFKAKSPRHDAAFLASYGHTGGSRTGIGITAVGNDGADIASAQVILAHAYTCGAHTIGRESAG